VTNAAPFATLLAAVNAGSHPRALGQWTPTACRVWRDAGANVGLLEAAFAWEPSTGRLARPDDEPLIRERRALMEAATAAALAARPAS
jgi:hypothetical protein